MATKRKDKNRIVLRTGESYRKNDDRYSYRWTDSTGERHTVYAKTLNALRQLEREIATDISDGLRSSDTMTLNDIFETWKSITRGLSTSTYQYHHYWYNKYVRDSFGKRQIKSIKKSDVKLFYTRLVDSGVGIAGIGQVNKILSQLFDIAVEDEYLRNNPSKGAFKDLKAMYPKEKRHALTADQTRLFVDYLSTEESNKRMYPLFIVLLNTGMRLGEATGLTWNDIDFEENEIHVNHTLSYFFHSTERDKRSGAYFEIHTPKTESGTRVIPMLGVVRDALIFEKKTQDKLGVQCKMAIDGVSDFVFLNNNGRPYQPATIRYHLKRIIEQCNQRQLEIGSSLYLPKFSCHTLRHTFATRLCERGVNVKVIQDVMGHANVSITLNIYTDVTAESKRNAFDNMTPI